MKSTTILHLLGILAASCLATTSQAQQTEAQASNQENRNWYYGSESPVVETKTLAQQKAETRAQQRTARLETYRWLGYSPSRPPAPVNPFTSSNSLQWKNSERYQNTVWYSGYRPKYYYQSHYRFR